MNFLKGVTAKGLLVPYEDYKPLFDYKKINSYLATFTTEQRTELMQKMVSLAPQED